jgi:hypothetical protein
VNAPPATAVALVAAAAAGRTAPTPVPSLRALRRQRAKGARAPAADQGSWAYDAKAATLVITLPAQPTTVPFNVTVTLACPSAAAVKASATHGGKAGGHSSVGAGGGCGVDSMLSGISGLVTRAVAAKETLNEARICPGEATGQTSSGATQELASLADVLGHHANLADGGGEETSAQAVDNFWAAVAAAPSMVAAALAELNAVDVESLGNSAWRLARAKALLEEASNDLA